MDVIQKDRLLRLWREAVTWAGLILALISGGAAALLSLRYLSPSGGGRAAAVIVPRVDPVVKRLSAQLAALEKRPADLESATPDGTSPPATRDMVRIKRGLAELRRDVNAIEGVVMDNPAKALEVVLIRRELEGLRESR
jgi:hypothetical protein